jgi:hypothetical protein
MLIALVFISALALEMIATIISVIGLSTLFGANTLIIALAISLDVAKLTTVTVLYTYWGKLRGLMKVYALTAAFITMLITSAGSAGYLSAEFQKAVMGTQEVGLRVDLLKQEQKKLEERKKQIDAGIAAIPDRYTASQKLRLMAQFKEEQVQVTTRLSEIDKQLPTLQVDQINIEAKAGPILYISKAFNIPVESAVKWVILLIVFVFDPLAVYLIICGNFLLHQRRMTQGASVTDAGLVTEQAPQPVVAPPAPAPVEAAAEHAEQEQPYIPPEVKLVGIEDVQPTAFEPLTLPPEPPLGTIKPESEAPQRPVAPPRRIVRPKAMQRPVTQDHAAPAPVVTAAPAAPAPLRHATLADVPADDSVQIADPSQVPTNSTVRSQYK